MAINDPQKVDFLLKKVGYELGKTADANLKSPANEIVSSPITISSQNLWLDTIPTNPDGSNVVESFSIKLDPDSTSEKTGEPVSRSWLAASGKKEWISKSYGAAYGVRVWIAENNFNLSQALTPNNATEIQPAGGANNDGFFVDFIAGIIHFADTNLPTALTSAKSIFVTGWRYKGKKGQDTARKSLDLTQFANTSAANLRNKIIETTGSGALVFQSGCSLHSPVVFGPASFNNDVGISGNLNVTGNLTFTSIASLGLANISDIFMSDAYIMKTIGGKSYSDWEESQTAEEKWAHGELRIKASGADFSHYLSVNGTGVSLSGHKHVFNDVTNFCDGVDSCLTTEIIASTGIQFIEKNNELNIALSGQSLKLHNFNDSGIIVRQSNGNFVGRALNSGNNITLSNRDGQQDGDIVIGLSQSVTGLTSLQSTTITGVNNIFSVETHPRLSFNNSTTTGLVNIYDLNVKHNLSVADNFIVNGTTIITNVETVQIKDPVILLGSGNNDPASASLNRGIQFVYYSGAIPSSGFMGWDSTSNKFIFQEQGNSFANIQSKSLTAEYVELEDKSNVAYAVRQDRTLTINVGSGIGLGGTPGQNLTADRSWSIGLTGLPLSLNNLSTEGIIVKSGESIITRNIMGTTHRVTVDNPGGKYGNISLSLPQDIHEQATVTFTGVNTDTLKNISKKISIPGNGVTPVGGGFDTISVVSLSGIPVQLDDTNITHFPYLIGFVIDGGTP